MADKEGATSAPNDDVKAKFREALERKKNASHRSAEGAEQTGSVHGPETTGGGQRMFRRKSGSS